MSSNKGLYVNYYDPYVSFCNLSYLLDEFLCCSKWCQVWIDACVRGECHRVYCLMARWVWCCFKIIQNILSDSGEWFGILLCNFNFLNWLSDLFIVEMTLTALPLWMRNSSRLITTVYFIHWSQLLSFGLVHMLGDGYRLWRMIIERVIFSGVILVFVEG